jgi:CheY-like chemotaxis protein
MAELQALAASGLPIDFILVDAAWGGDNPTAWGLEVAACASQTGARIALMDHFGRHNLQERQLIAGSTTFLNKPVGPQPLLLWLEGRANSAEPAEGLGGEPLAALSDLQILVAEDNLVNQKVIGQMLKKLGCQADIAVDGAQAVSAVERGRFDVVFMDVHMPEMDGYEATRALRSRLPQERQPHIIALTANAIMGDREKCLAAGMDDYLTKPLTLGALSAALNAARAARKEPRIILELAG